MADFLVGVARLVVEVAVAVVGDLVEVAAAAVEEVSER